MPTTITRTAPRSFQITWGGLGNLGRVLELYFGDGHSAVNSFMINEDGYHLSAEAIPGWDTYDRPGDSTIGFAIKVIEWLEDLTYDDKLEICKSRPLEGSRATRLTGWTATSDQIDDQIVLTIRPGWVE